jgi:hypothetical protein
MNDPIQRGPEMQELRHDIPVRSAPRDETNDGTTISITNPDMMLSMTVLLITCLVLAVLAHLVV